MYKSVLIIALQMVFYQAIAQKMFEVQFSNCPVKFILEDGDTFIEYQPNDSVLVTDFLSGLDAKQVEKLMGTVMMQIMVDTLNQICCVSYTNKTTISSNKLNVASRILAMKGWARKPNALTSENVCALVSITFDANEFTVIRTGYNRNKGRNAIRSSTYKRIAEVAPAATENSDIM